MSSARFGLHDITDVELLRTVVWVDDETKHFFSEEFGFPSAGAKHPKAFGAN